MFLTLMAGARSSPGERSGGALLQVGGQIVADNTLLFLTELLWAALTLAGHATLGAVGLSFCMSGGTFLGRSGWGYLLGGVLLPIRADIRWKVVKMVLGFGLLVTAAQVADFLYSPTDYILIDRLLSPLDLATYAPAVQIDGGLLLMVAAIATVLLPKAAIAHAADDAVTLRSITFEERLPARRSSSSGPPRSGAIPLDISPVARRPDAGDAGDPSARADQHRDRRQ